VYVVDDILLTYIVLPYGKRLLGKGQDWLFKWLDSQLGEAGATLRQRMARRNDQVEVLKDLGHYVKENRGTADTLATAAYAAATGPGGVRSNEEFLMVVCDFFLTPVVEMVKVLEHPAVVPGFLTGTDWLTVIDVRTVPRGEQLEDLEVEQRTSMWGDPPPAEIVLWRGRLTENEKKHWLPRIWLVSAIDDEVARELGSTPGERSATLNELARDEDTTPDEFAKRLKNQPFVTAITRQNVVVRRSQVWFGGLPPSTTGKSDKIPWAKSSAGIQTMRKELERQLGDQQDEQERWIKALTNWANGGPAPGDS
jgi:hypothetical protein